MDEHNEVVNLRLKNLEQSYKELRQDIKDILEVVTRMDKRVGLIPENGLHCNIHEIQIDGLMKRVDKIEVSTDTLNRKVITWSSVFAVILFLLSQLIIPYVLGNFKINHVNTSPKIDYSISPTNGLTTK